MSDETYRTDCVTGVTPCLHGCHHGECYRQKRPRPAVDAIEEPTAFEIQRDTLARQLAAHEALVPADLREDGWTAAAALRDYATRHENSAGNHPGSAEGADPSGSVDLNDRGASGSVEQMGPDPELRAHRSGGSTSAGEHSTPFRWDPETSRHRYATEDEKTDLDADGEHQDEWLR